MIRPWEPGDDEALRAGFVDAYNGQPLNDAWTSATAAAYLGELRGIPRSPVLVAVDDSQFVGATFFPARTWQDESEIYIDEFFASPRRIGTASAVTRQVSALGQRGYGAVGVRMRCCLRRV